MNATVAAPQKAPAGSFREVWLITLGHGLTHWYPSTFYLLLPIIGRELSLSYTQIGLIMTCQYIAGAVANIPGGMIVDTVGRKGVLMALSLFWVGFPYLLMGFTHGYLMLLAAWRSSASATACGTPPRSRRSRAAIPIARAWCSRCTAWAAMWATPSRRSSWDRSSRCSPGAKSSVINVIPGC
jgi:sugar phosphate permease